jgi:hypothetical protein
MGSGDIAPLFFNSALDGDEWSALLSDRFIPVERASPYPSYRRLGGPQNRSGEEIYFCSCLESSPGLAALLSYLLESNVTPVLCPQTPLTSVLFLEPGVRLRTHTKQHITLQFCMQNPSSWGGLHSWSTAPLAIGCEFGEIVPVLTLFFRSN